jgi:hypothetical protein
MSEHEAIEHVSYALLDDGQASLADWYATPMVHRHADALLLVAEQAIQHRLRTGACSFQAQLLRLVCHWWQHPDVQADYEELRQAAGSPHQFALLHLLYGQLLTSRKLEPAKQQLASGFRHAAALLSSAEYFRLLRRHEVLGMLAFGKTPATAQDLPALLAEAAVIERLQRGKRTAYTSGHHDTMG